MEACCWKIEKYARFVNRGHSTGDDEESVTKDETEWKVRHLTCRQRH